MKNDAVFTVRLPQKVLDMIVSIGNGSRRAGLEKILWHYTDNTDDRLKDAYDMIEDLKSQIEDRRAIIKKYIGLLDKYEGKK